MSSTTARLFWIIDDNTEPDEPAYLQEHAPFYETVTVMKEGNCDYEVHFKAIDKCVIFPAPAPGADGSICEGLLFFDDWLIFLEIKDNDQQGYAETAKNQLSRSIKVFGASHPAHLAASSVRKAYIANNDKPKAPNFSQTEIDKFEFQNAGFELVKSTKILIP
jgi:hypothetical protein